MKLELSSEGSINEVRDLLERVVPAHLTAIVEVICNTHAYLAGFTLRRRTLFHGLNKQIAVNLRHSHRQCLQLLLLATAAILQVPGVVNVTALRINGAAADLELAENGLLQQIPVLGEVEVRA